MSLRITFQNIPTARPMTIDLAAAESFMKGVFKVASNGADVLSDRTDPTLTGRDRNIDITNESIDRLRAHLARACEESCWNETAAAGQTLITIDLSRVETLKLQLAA